jgi:hypothetical protein
MKKVKNLAFDLAKEIVTEKDNKVLVPQNRDQSIKITKESFLIYSLYTPIKYV